MKIKNISSFVGSSVKVIKKHSPSILTAASIISGGASCILTVKATIKAHDIYIKMLEDSDYDERPTKKEVFAEVYKFYIPPLTMFLSSSICSILSNAINIKRQAAITSAYTLAEMALRNKNEKLVELLTNGKENKKTKMYDDISKKELIENPVKDDSIISTGHGNTLCYDSWSGRYFRSNIEFIRKKANDINADLNNELSIGLNDFYFELGLPQIRGAEHVGWNVNCNQVELVFSTHLADNGEPCLVLNYATEPIVDYDDTFRY